MEGLPLGFSYTSFSSLLSIPLIMPPLLFLFHYFLGSSLDSVFPGGHGGVVGVVFSSSQSFCYIVSILKVFVKFFIV